jgi:TatD DNase family protein
MRLVDVHCHLESEEFAGKLDGIIEDARRTGIVRLITASIVPEQWDVSAGLAERYPEVEFAWGVHPWYIRPEFEADLPRLADARSRGACAIGEIGLDRKSDSVPLDLQCRFFETQLCIAKDLGLPVVVHCRAAFDLLLEFGKKVGLAPCGGVVHNFSGSAELAGQLSRYGLSFSMGGTLTYRNSRKKREVLEAIYPERFLLETDSPDIPPVEARDRPNVPANILYNLRAAAEVLGEPEELIAEQTTENAIRIFGLELGPRSQVELGNEPDEPKEL